MTDTIIKIGMHTGHIVSIDDDVHFQTLLSFAYKRSCLENELIFASSALEGIQLIKKEESLIPALLLIDINMPEINGFQLIEKLHEENLVDRCLTEIAILSSSNNKTDSEKALSKGADAYYEKPLDIFKLKFMGKLD